MFGDAWVLHIPPRGPVRCPRVLLPPLEIHAQVQLIIWGCEVPLQRARRERPGKTRPRAKPLSGAWPEQPATTAPGVRAGQGRRFHRTAQHRQTRHSQGLSQKCQGRRCQGPGQRVQGRSFQGLGQQSQGPCQPDQGRGSGHTGQRRRLLGLQARIHGQPSCRNVQARCAMHLRRRRG